MANKKACWNPLNKPYSADYMEIVSGERVYLKDENGKEYIDASSALWNTNYGYSDDVTMDAIKEQLSQLPFVNPIIMNTPINNKLAELLCDITHSGIEKVIFTCSGSEATEAAIKLCRKYADLTGKKNRTIASFEVSYHGNYYGSMAVSNYIGDMKEGYGPMLDGFASLRVPFCRCCKAGEISEECKQTMLDRLDEELRLYKDELCGIILESVIASGGVIAVPDFYMKHLYDFCLENDILLICDEVAAGFARTGHMFAYQKHNIRPHIITMSKGIINGYLPLGAVCVSEQIVKEFEKHDKAIFHLSTQDGNPICLAAAYANINRMLDDDAAGMVKELSKKFQEGLYEKIGRLDHVFDIRIEGLMIGIDLIQPDTNLQLSQDKLNQLLERIFSLGCVARSSYVNNFASSILIFPPFIVTDEEIIKIVNIIGQAFAEEGLS